jgi:hypothetical protein
MKLKKIELDVDFIGGSKPLTVKEEKELSDYFKKTKLKRQKSTLGVDKKRKSLAKV